MHVFPMTRREKIVGCVGLWVVLVAAWAVVFWQMYRSLGL